MTARVQATLLTVALLVALIVAMMIQPTGYSLLSPGPTLNVLGDNGTKPIVTIKGHKSYPTSGELLMLTVYEMPPDQSLSLVGAVQHWLSDPTSVYPSDALYPAGTTQQDNTKEGAAEMASAQDLAKAAALKQMGITLGSQVAIASVDSKGPSFGKIKTGDVLVSVGGHTISTPAQGVKAVRAFKPGETIPVVVKRKDALVHLRIVSVALGTKGSAAATPRIGVQLAPRFAFPFAINLNIPDNIMGPSAGMMFALTIYDRLTPGSLTKGHEIAGTGTIDADGNVGGIGGIAQKIKAAQRDGAELFLAPASNCDEVARASYNHRTMRVVKVSTLDQAVKAIKAWASNPTAALPGCGS